MSLLDDVSIVVTPNGYKAGELYAVIPVPTEGAEEVTNGDFATDSDWNEGTNVDISNGKTNFVDVAKGERQQQNFGFTNGQTMNAGTTLFLAVSAITLTSGIAICYYDQVI